MTQRKLLIQLLGSVTEEELDMHYRHSTGCYRDATITPQIADWYDRMIAANAQRKLYDQKKLKHRIVLIKGKLIIRSFTKEMSMGEKIRLLFHYLSFSDVMQAALTIMAQRIRGIGRSSMA